MSKKKYRFSWWSQAGILRNEVGKLIGLEGNRRLGRDILAGVFYVTGVNKEEGKRAGCSIQQRLPVDMARMIKPSFLLYSFYNMLLDDKMAKRFCCRLYVHAFVVEFLQKRLTIGGLHGIVLNDARQTMPAQITEGIKCFITQWEI